MKDVLQSTMVKIFVVFLLSATAISLTTEANDSYGIIQGGKSWIVSVIGLSTVVYAIILAYSDAKIVIKGIHWSRGISRFILLSFFPVILALQHNRLNDLLLAGHALVMFGIVFDIFYNLKKDETFGYVGTQALIDRVVRWMNVHTPLGYVGAFWPTLIKLVLWLMSMELLKKYYL